MPILNTNPPKDWLAVGPESFRREVTNALRSRIPKRLRVPRGPKYVGDLSPKERATVLRNEAKRLSRGHVNVRLADGTWATVPRVCTEGYGQVETVRQMLDTGTFPWGEEWTP